MYSDAASIAGATSLFAVCSECQYTMLLTVIDGPPGNYFLEAAKAPQADIVFVQAAVTNTG